jgi:putative endonuclease
MHYLYILHSNAVDKFYVGETYDIENRVLNHNQHYYSNSFTKIANDWKLVFSFNCVDESEAIYLEKFIKRMKSTVFIQKIISNPKILDDILSKR